MGPVDERFHRVFEVGATEGGLAVRGFVQERFLRAFGAVAPVVPPITPAGDTLNLWPLTREELFVILDMMN